MSFILAPPLAPRNESSFVMPTPMVRTNSFFANHARADSFYPTGPKQPSYVPPGASFYGNQAPMPVPSRAPPRQSSFYGNEPPKAKSMVVQPKGPLQEPVPDRRFVEAPVYDEEEESESEPEYTANKSQFKRFTSTNRATNVGKIEISGKRISRRRRQNGDCCV
eukprot:gnl/MRDRNA2_/MRDRNA2_89487_c0_seq1.p1 gnl/MRDRNA2_/MRDRNA2_89487_c0~~gnl/MRDRNA2_/MRDRNA2_89487_c0_seq1.p1  ORF type:complete len:164 (+),score=23.23 gnl/MRDRNA2_/MRDRNA2_89487_c0_seq1:83-574(+)